MKVSGDMADDDKLLGRSCPVFGVKSGIPIIGLGILMILFGIIPLLLQIPLSIPVMLVFIGFGLFLIWAGMSR